MDFHRARIVSWWIPRWVLECPRNVRGSFRVLCSLMFHFPPKQKTPPPCFSSCFALRAPFLPVIRFDSPLQFTHPFLVRSDHVLGLKKVNHLSCVLPSSSWPKTHWRISFKNPTLIFCYWTLWWTWTCPQLVYSCTLNRMVITFTSGPFSFRDLKTTGAH